MGEVSGKLFSLSVRLAYNHSLQNHPEHSHCPGLERVGGSMNERGKKFRADLRSKEVHRHVPVKQRPALHQFFIG